MRRTVSGDTCNRDHNEGEADTKDFSHEQSTPKQVNDQRQIADKQPNFEPSFAPQLVIEPSLIEHQASDAWKQKS